MKIKLTGEYKSLRDFESDELPDFTVITGKNGSGKTQLLELLKDANSPKKRIIELIPKQRKLIQFEGIEPNGFNNTSKNSWVSYVSNFDERWFNLRISIRYFFSYLIGKKINFKELRNSKSNYIKEFSNEIDSLNFFDPNEKRTIEFETKQEIINSIEDINITQYEKEFDLMILISNYLKKDSLEITKADLYKVPIPAKFFTGNSLFNTDFSRICYAYAMNRYINSERYFRKKYQNESNKSISKNEFNKSKKAPWVEFNELLNRTKIDYEVIGMDENEFVPEIDFQLILKKKSTESIVNASSLSSGEKIVFGLLLKLYISSYFDHGLIYPSLILLDEPDAHLHPELTTILIEVLNNTFVEKLDIKVLITTHSPSTVALSPDESIFELNNIGECSLKRIGRDKALELLTGSIPTLSIDYKNHKQVFVESETDGKYFRKIFDTLKRNDQELNSPLYFIDNPMGKGNSALVITTTKKFRKAGNKSVYGIIDWDQKNKSEDFTLVHGENERHTIENYLLDPIYIAALFLEKGAHEIHDITGISKDESPYRIIELDESKLQSVSDQILSKVEEKFPALKRQKDLKTVSYLNGKSLQLPLWFLLSKHEELIDRFTSTFQFLASLIQKDGEGKIQEELTRVICRCYPMIPKDTVDLLTQISNGK